MPYTGDDWRSPGDFWVKTGSGWQKLDALRANVNRHIKRIAMNKKEKSLQNELNHKSDTFQEALIQPSQSCHQDNSPAFLGGALARYLLLPRGKGVYFTLGEVLLRLDIAGCACDPRRFIYVCRMLELMVCSHFVCFSGTAQKNLLYALEETVDVAIESQKNLRHVRRIIRTAIQELTKQQYTHVGSAATWRARLAMLEDMNNKLNKIEIIEPHEDDNTLAMIELPDDCIRLIFRRFADHEDIINTGATDKKLYKFSNEPLLWKHFCFFHFTKEQILREIGVGADENAVRWKACYQKLYKRNGRRELYAEMLHICCHCNCLFWKNGGHPCSLETAPEGSKRMYDPDMVIPSIPITPQQFMEMFPTGSTPP
ncbi:F-box only protein 32-like [Amphiura filiformis]|uniref:F-box only protein 32-like n=1 Tax=Amphiura filiformis TaxID=82378 RepID=UPI003B2104EC